MWSVLGLSCCSLLMVFIGAFSKVLVLMFLIRMLHQRLYAMGLIGLLIRRRPMSRRRPVPMRLLRLV